MFNDKLKQTLIALMALASVAAAAEAKTVNTIDASWGTAPSTGGNFWSDDYTLSFTLDTLYSLEKSGSVIASYYGTGTTDAYGFNAIVLGGSGTALTLTVGRGKASSTALDADTTFTFKDSVTFTTAIQKGVTYTLSVDGATGAMTPTLSWDGGSETLASDSGNMNGNTATMNTALNKGTITVPEPTTATLSLLALAGLAARRRRK